MARTFLVGGLALLWLTRFRREPVLVYLGLSGLVAWAACLCGLVVPEAGPARLLGWLAITSGGCSLATWGIGELARRRDDSFYSHPCFLMASALAVGASILAFDARWLSVDSYRLGVAAMLVGSASLSLVAGSRRWPAASVLAAGSAVGASYLALLSQGPADPSRVYVLGLVAALEAIACRGVATLVRKATRDPASILARPLDFWALALMLGAIPLGLDSTATLLAVAVASVLMIGGFPSSAWLYGTLLAVGAAVHRLWLVGASGDGLIPAVVIGAYACWALAVALQRYGPRAFGRFGLPDLRWHVPPVRTALGLGVLAVAIRVWAILDRGGPWAALPWLPWALAWLCLMMLRFDPSRGWVYVSVALTGAGFAAILEPVARPGGWWLSASMALAILWSLAGRGAERVEGAFRRRLGIAEGRDSGVFGEASLAGFVLSGASLVSVVSLATFTPSATLAFGWWDAGLALALAALYVGLEGRRFGRDAVLLGLEAVAWLAAWWLAAPGSPILGRLGIDRDAYLAVATAVVSLVVVVLGGWAGRRTSGGVDDPSSVVEPPRRALLVEATSWLGFGLGIVAVYFSTWTSGRVAFLGLVTTTAALGLLAVGGRRLESAIAGALTWCLAFAVGAVVAARAWGVAEGDLPRFAGLGFVSALYGLWWASGWVRRRDARKGGDPSGGGRVASALEWVAIVATAPATLFASVSQDAPGTGSVLLFALAGFFAMVAWRRVAEWPSYLAQGFLLACYFLARPILAPSSGVDAVVLSLFAYLDLGLSELMGRLRWPHLARPTLRFAMALPLVPILQASGQDRWDNGVGQFVLLATAAFYALAALRLRSKGPAYASLVLINAFLWLSWYRMGWRVADSPQFYLIPVGASSILFAEVNRKELGRSVVQGARNLGLVLIYASLISPIWQGQSFGAWLTLLLLSLAGIFAGIGLRVQSFLWLGLACFVLDVTYQLARLGVDHALARWAVMLSLGVALILFVALNEKKRIVATMRAYYDEARTWE